MAREEFRKYLLTNEQTGFMDLYLDKLVEGGLATKLFSSGVCYIRKETYGEVIIAGLDENGLQLFGDYKALDEMMGGAKEEGLGKIVRMSDLRKTSRDVNMGLPQ